MKRNHQTRLLTKITLTLCAVVTMLTACNGGNSSSAAPPTVSGAVLQPGALKIPVMARGGASASTGNSLQNGSSGKFENPVISYLFEAANDAAAEAAGGIALNGAENLLNMMGITILESPEEAKYHQIEDKLSDIQASIASLNDALNQYVGMYESNVVNDYNQNFFNIEGDVGTIYANLGQDIYQSPNLDLATQQSYITLWEDGVEPVLPAEVAALQNVKGILDLFYNFPSSLAIDIATLSDDSSDSYLKSDNVSLKIAENSDGSWSSIGRASPSSTPFAHGLELIFAVFKNDHPMYGDANGSSQNLLLSKAEWAQVVMSELFKNMVSLQRTYRIIDFIIKAKFNPDNSQLAGLNLPPFMGNPLNLTVASNELTQIYRYKTYILYSEAMSAIQRFKTGAPGSDISDFVLPASCDNPIGPTLPGGASAESMNLATIRANSGKYSWNGSNYTTECSNASKGVTVTQQDVVHMCGSGKLVNLNGHIYCDYKNPVLKSNLNLQFEQLLQGDLSGAAIFGLQPQTNPLDVRNIDASSHLVAYSSSTAQTRLKFINDQLPKIHLRNYNPMNLYGNDPDDNYYTAIQDLNHGTMYLFGEFKLPFGNVALPFAYIQCIPHDLYCSVNENQANKTSWLSFSDPTYGTDSSLAITRPENITNNQFSFDYTSH